jgi:integrase
MGLKLGLNSKTKKGDISIDNNNGRIRLRWRYSGDRYHLNIPYNYIPENLHHATITATEIKLDILKGCFDTSLEKYRETESSTKLQEVKETIPITLNFLHELTTLFNDWTKNVRNIDIDNSNDYLYLRRVLEKWIDVPIENVAQKLNEESWSISTYNRRLTSLKLFFNWLVRTGKISTNPLFEVVRKRGGKRKKSARRTPISESAIISFLNAVKSDTYCPSNSRFKHSHYYPFLLFIFLTGVRNAEAIGLKVKHIDFNKGHIEISESLARTTKGSNHASRITKGTKMDNTRLLPMSDELRELLTVQIYDKNPNDLVFTSPNGLSIDDRMLKRRILKPVMIKLGIGDKDLYVARHSFGTRAIQQGMALTDVAYLMGHTTIETTSRNYVDVGKPAVKLPLISNK